MQKVTPLIPNIEEKNEDDGEVHHAYEDDNDHASVHRDPHNHLTHNLHKIWQEADLSPVIYLGHNWIKTEETKTLVRIKSV